MAYRLSASLIVLGLVAAASGSASAGPTGPLLIAQADAPPPEETTGAPGAASQTPAPPPRDLGEELPPTRPADLSYGVAARLRWVSVPGWLLSEFTKKNVPLSSWGTGLSLFRRKDNLDIAVSFNYQNMSPPAGNWLGSSNSAATDTSLLQFESFALYAFDVSFIWRTSFTDWFGIHYGAGFGVGILGGYIERTKDQNGDCTDANVSDTTKCTPTPSTAAHLADVPPAVPIINVQLGLDFRVPTVRGWEARLEGGFYDAFYLGGGVGYTF